MLPILTNYTNTGAEKQRAAGDFYLINNTIGSTALPTITRDININ